MKGYRKYFGKKILWFVITFIVAVILNFFLPRMMPADPVAAITGKTVELHCRIDPTVLGGIRLDYDGKRVDGTVKNRLDAMAALLKNTVL